MAPRKKEIKFTKADAKLFYGKRQAEFIIALREMLDMVDLLKGHFPVLAYEMKLILYEMGKLVPHTSKAASASWQWDPGHEERRRQRYEKWKAHYEQVYRDDMEAGRWALDRLKELREQYNSPLLPKPEPESKLEPLAILAKWQREIEAAAPDPDDQPLDSDVWGELNDLL